MTCRFQEEIELADFVLDRAESRFASFRTHYPDCIECSRSVAEWTRVLGVLESDAPVTSAHLDAATLALLVDGRDPLDPILKRSVDIHLEGCASCRRDLETAKALAPELVPGFASGEASPTKEGSRLDRIVRGFRAWVSRPAYSLVPAMGALALLLFLATQETKMPSSGVGVSLVADGAGARANSEAAPIPVDPVRSAQADRATPTIDERSAIAHTDAEPALEEKPPAGFPLPKSPEAPEPTRLAHADGHVRQPRLEPEPLTPRAAPQPTPRSQEIVGAAETRSRGSEPMLDNASASEEEVLLLAAHFPMEPIGYRAMLDPGFDTKIAYRAGFGGRANAAAEIPTPTNLAPESVGITFSETPTLYTHLPGPTAASLSVTLVDPDADDPLVETIVAGPHAEGFLGLSISDYGARLEAGVTYEWFVTVLADPDRPDRNPGARAAVRFVEPTESVRSALAEAAPADRAHRLAAAGAWLDAFHQLAEWRLRPDAPPRVSAAVADLVESVGLSPSVAAPAEASAR